MNVTSLSSAERKELTISLQEDPYTIMAKGQLNSEYFESSFLASNWKYSKLSHWLAQLRKLEYHAILFKSASFSMPTLSEKTDRVHRF